MGTKAPKIGADAHQDALRGRLARLRKALVKHDVDALLVTNPVDVGYLTGFLGGDSFLLVKSSGKPVVISDFRYEEELEPVRPIASVFIRKTGMDEAARDVAAGAKVKRLGFQAEHVSVADLARYKKVFKGAGLVATTGLVGDLRVIKDALEVAIMREAIRIQQDALEAVLKDLRDGRAIGRSEADIAAQLEGEMKSRGSSRPWFESIIAAGANGSLPHYRPADAKVRKGQPLLIDWGSTYLGYGGDMTRTFSAGTWPAKIREIYQIVKDAQEMAAMALAPGKTAHEIDAIARNHITRHGYGKEFGHGLGHGLGMTKEPPFLHPLYPDRVLEVGHVCTVEPGIYLPGVGGVRIEDLYVLTEGGAENFCSMPKDIEWATL